MSGLISGASASLNNLFGGKTGTWLDRYKPASFRGVGFKVEEHTLTGGRHIAFHEFPLRDNGDAEDLGRKKRGYAIRGYVIGDNYDQDRNKLLDALESGAGPGTLVHPYLGSFSVVCADYRMSESKERGNVATFDMVFLPGAASTAFSGKQNTSSSLLGGLSSIIPIAKEAFVIGSLIASKPGFLGSLMGGLLKDAAGSLVSGLTGLPSGSVTGLISTVEAMASSPTDTSATADLTGAAFAATAAAVVAFVGGDTNAGADIVTGTQPYAGTPADPSYGLADMAVWGGTLAPVLAPSGAVVAPQPSGNGFGGAVPAAAADVTATRQQQANNQQAVANLVQDMATTAVATVYTQTEWVSAAAAQAARDQLLALINARSEAAALAGQMQLYLAWVAVAALAVADLTAQAQKLPQLGAYSLAAPTTALALSQRLYQTATRADELVQLNDSWHPLFMPPSGRALVQ